MKNSIILVVLGMVLVLSVTINGKPIEEDDVGSRASDIVKHRDEAKSIKSHDANLERVLDLAIKHIIQKDLENGTEDDEDYDEDDDDSFRRFARSRGKSKFWKRRPFW